MIRGHYLGVCQFIARPSRALLNLLWLTLVLWPVTASARPQSPLEAVTDNISYNIGETVRLRISSPSSQPPPALDMRITLRYGGESNAILERAPLTAPKSAAGDEYREAWKVPPGARTGRYEIDLVGLDPKTHQEVFNLRRAATFAVHRKLVRIERIDLGKTFFTSGDPVACRAVLRNLTDRTLTGLRVEFSERYWPWIAPTSERAGVEVFPIVTDMVIKPGVAVEVRSARAAVARKVTQPAVQQYAVVVWDSRRETVYDIAFSPLTFIRPPGPGSEMPYPLQYVYPNLASVNTASYRQFDRAEFGSTAIQFDRNHTMYAPGDTATVKFTIANFTDQPWRDVTIRASLRSLGSAEFARQIVGEKMDLAPSSARLEREVKFVLPSDGSGAYRVVVEVGHSTGEILAAGQLELAANPLPKSLLVFCAHEDDEGAHAGIIRAAVENSTPIHVVYFTSGDAGSCDRYYQHSCSPAEALNFGALRMEEARASLGHLGVPRENIFFLGLPDGGSGEIWSRHVAFSHPYLSVLLASDHAPYEGLYRPNLPFARASVVEAAKELIRKFQPEWIYAGHPDERHVDHRTNQWFVVEALQELLREGVVTPQLTLLVDQSYGPGPQKPAPYHYEKHTLLVTPEARAKAQEASWFYQSQSGNRNLGRIRSRDQLPRQEIHLRVLDWNEHEGWNKKD